MKSSSTPTLVSAAVLLGLLAVAWLLPGAHELWCPHDHGGGVAALGGHGHHGDSCCGDLGANSSAGAEEAPSPTRKGPRYQARTDSVQESCPLNLLMPTPATGVSGSQGCSAPKVARVDVPELGAAWVADTTRYLLAPKNSPPEQSPRRAA